MGKIKVVHYLNNAFAGYGFEEAAGMGFEFLEGAKGPGLPLQAQLGDDYEIVATIVCGDDYFSAEPEANAAKAVEMIKEKGITPDLAFAGPAFAAGRYTVSAGAFCQAVSQAFGIPAITGMDAESPGMDMYRKYCYIVKTGNNARELPKTIAKMAKLGKALMTPSEEVKLTTLENIPSPVEFEYFTRGQLRNTYTDKTVAERSVELLVKKLNGEEFVSEVIPERFDVFDIPKAVPDMTKAKIAFVSDGGLVPAGNPDNCQTRSNLVWGCYDLEKIMTEGNYTVVHAGYFNDYVLQDPNRLLPVDVLKDKVNAGEVGGIVNNFYSNPACTTVSAQCQKNGAEIAQELLKDGADAVILTSTWGTSTRCGSTIAREIERVGIPLVQVTAIPNIAQMLGVNRIVVGAAVPNPTGNPKLGELEHDYRKHLLDECLKLLAEDVEGVTTVIA